MTAGQDGDDPTRHATVSMSDNLGASRFELRIDGRLIGSSLYEDTGNGRGFEHTAVAVELQGRGLAGRLITFALDEARASGRAVLPFCPFVRAFIATHPEYVDLVEEPKRFGLSTPPATPQTPEG